MNETNWEEIELIETVKEIAEEKGNEITELYTSPNLNLTIWVHLEGRQERIEIVVPSRDLRCYQTDSNVRRRMDEMVRTRLRGT